MLEVSRVGVGESEDEIELSLELSIGGGRYGKCEKPRQRMIEESSSFSRENNESVVENVVIPRAGFTFPEASVIGIGGEFQVEAGIESGIGSVIPETVDQNRRREIQALRRLEARRKRDERMRRSTVGFRGITINGNGSNYFDNAGLEAQKLQERAQDRKNREDESLLDDHKLHRKKETVKVTNFAMKNDETAIHNHEKMQVVSQCGPLKSGFLYYPYRAQPGAVAGIVRKEEEVVEKKHNNMVQPVACGSFRLYVNGNGNNLAIVRQNSETTAHNQSGIISRIVNKNAASNGSLERS